MGGIVLSAVTYLVTVYVCDSVYCDVSEPMTIGRMLLLIITSAVLKVSVTVLRVGVAPIV